MNVLKFAWCKVIHPVAAMAAACLLLLIPMYYWAHSEGMVDGRAKAVAESDPDREKRRQEARQVVFRQFEDSVQEVTRGPIRPD